MADALSNAQAMINLILEVTKNKEMPSEFGLEMIKAYASIAQAEQLKRIADSLERLTQTIEESNS